MKKIIVLIVALYSVVLSFDDLKIDVKLDKPFYSPMDTVRIALLVSIPDGFHLYSNPLGPGVGKPLILSVGNSSEIRWINALREQPVKFQPSMGEWVWAFEKETYLFVVGIVSENITSSIATSITIDALMCENSCVPIVKKIDVDIPIKRLSKELIKSSFSEYELIKSSFLKSEHMPLENGNDLSSMSKADDDISYVVASIGENQSSKWDYTPKENKIKFNISWALFFAFIAGIILNFMPCVLPVLGIKIMSFSEGRSDSKRTVLMHSIAFAAGMITIFLVLGTLAAFANLSWGAQFQKPAFIVGVVSMIFVFALGMFDVFIILVPNSIAQLDQKRGVKKGYLSDFLKGAFATILATPCSGPFLGATIAWTLTQNAVIIYAVFMALGLGMASPYVLLASSERLLRFVPKPGAWMEDFKKIMGFFLFGFAIYLMIGLPVSLVLPTIGFCTVLAFVVVLYGRIAPFGSSIKRKIITIVIVLFVAWGGWYLNFNLLRGFISLEKADNYENESGMWESFTAEKLMAAHANGRHVVVDFTANWCMNCQFNKLRVYYSPKVVELLKKKNVLTLKADLTTENIPAESLLHHLGSRSVPFMAIFSGADPFNPVILRDIVKKENFIKQIKLLPEKM